VFRCSSETRTRLDVESVTFPPRAIPFMEHIKKIVELQQQRDFHKQRLFLLSDMSSIGSGSESEAASVTESSNVASESDVDFPEETPRKRRRTSPSNENPEKIIARPSAPFLSRIKAKKTAVSPQKSKESEDSIDMKETEDSVSTPTVKLEKSTFANIDVHPWLVRSLANMAITRPTGIQKGCIPQILKGRDCIGGSRTGSGKTVAFAVPILQKWAEDPVGIFAVVLTPTRYVL
jgi:ATP-dependent RNA helicase DDX49/DBP8